MRAVRGWTHRRSSAAAIYFSDTPHFPLATSHCALCSATLPPSPRPSDRAPRQLALFRSVNPLFGVFLVHQLGIADRKERIQAFEAALDFPGPVARYVRVPKQEFLPPGPLATQRLDQQLLQLGLATAEELVQKPKEEEEPWKPRRSYDAAQDEEPKWVLSVAEKLRRLFDYEHPGVFDLRTRAVWAAGELLMEFNGNFDKYVGSKDMTKQEGILFRHLLRLILLLREFRPLAPPDLDPAAWRYDLDEVVDQLTASCRAVDPAEHRSGAGSGRGTDGGREGIRCGDTRVTNIGRTSLHSSGCVLRDFPPEPRSAFSGLRFPLFFRRASMLHHRARD